MGMLRNDISWFLINDVIVVSVRQTQRCFLWVALNQVDQNDCILFSDDSISRVVQFMLQIIWFSFHLHTLINPTTTEPHWWHIKTTKLTKHFFLHKQKHQCQMNHYLFEVFTLKKTYSKLVICVAMQIS